MKKERIKFVAINFLQYFALGILMGWIITLLREGAPSFYFGGFVLGGYSLIKSYKKYHTKSFENSN